jgi:hypothetical protein
MNKISGWKPRIARMFVVAPASPYTWAVAFSRQLIPGAIFTTKAAAVAYASWLARSAGLDRSNVKILGA